METADGMLSIKNIFAINFALEWNSIQYVLSEFKSAVTNCVTTVHH